MADEKLPTRDEIAQLPLMAVVAFSARCARRVQPLFKQSWPDAPQHYLEAIERAIECSELFAGHKRGKLFDVTPLETVANAARDAARDATTIRGAAALAAARAAQASAEAADAAAFAARAALVVVGIARGAVVAPAAAAAAARSVVTVAAAAAAAARSVVAVANSVTYITEASPIQIALSSIRSDFTRLLDASRRESWDDTTPVPPSFFESLAVSLLKSTPADPLEADEHVAMLLQAFGEPGVNARTLAEHLLAMYKALNQYTLAKYGRHLSRGQFRRLVLLRSGVPA